MSEEHKALGYRPPPGSLAAQAQSAAAKHPNGVLDGHPVIHDLQRAALEDVAKIEANAASAAAAINLDTIGEGSHLHPHFVPNTELMSYFHSRSSQTHVRRTQGSGLPTSTRIARRRSPSCGC